MMTDTPVNAELKEIHLKTMLHSLLWTSFAFKYGSRTDAVSVGAVKMQRPKDSGRCINLHWPVSPFVGRKARLLPSPASDSHLAAYNKPLFSHHSKATKQMIFTSKATLPQGGGIGGKEAKNGSGK